ncbi:hypothetical protein B4O97_04010 [Marispirochaeta aestuarii]|uniref:Helix-turn-helix domain-containing protein n=1 Tax=Marispirochaeta aestuarii TaxID=1963862 RepID=A0A1Y1S2R9_9SPIO|nr:hypothetical protein B4O97_04010 [Marispirochaeta aestuarii]
MRILTSYETAEMLRISMPTLYRHVRDGLIPCLRVGRRKLFRYSDIEKFIDNQISDGSTNGV